MITNILLTSTKGNKIYLLKIKKTTKKHKTINQDKL